MHNINNFKKAVKIMSHIDKNDDETTLNLIRNSLLYNLNARPYIFFLLYMDVHFILDIVPIYINNIESNVQTVIIDMGIKKIQSIIQNVYIFNNFERSTRFYFVTQSNLYGSKYINIANILYV